MSKQILLIGGNGYIGRRLLSFLREKSYEVINVDNCYYGHFDEDLFVDYNQLSSDYLGQFHCIILLAGHSCPSMCGNDFKSCWKNNVENFVTLLDRKPKEVPLIYASTAAILDEVGSLIDPVDVYTLSKKTIEEIAKFYPNTVGLRFGTIAGISENFRQENLLNSLSVNAFKNKSISISNPNLIRSILGLDDCCRALEQIIVQGIKNPIYNLISFSGSIIEIGREIQRISNCDLAINNSMSTSYSFKGSSEQFEKDYQFQFQDTIPSLYKEITENLDKIKNSVPRNYLQYG